MKELSVVLRQKICLHNYKKILKDSGFKIDSVNRTRTTGLWPIFMYPGSQYIVSAIRMP